MASDSPHIPPENGNLKKARTEYHNGVITPRKSTLKRKCTALYRERDPHNLWLPQKSNIIPAHTSVCHGHDYSTHGDKVSTLINTVEEEYHPSKYAKSSIFSTMYGKIYRKTVRLINSLHTSSVLMDTRPMDHYTLCGINFKQVTTIPPLKPLDNTSNFDPTHIQCVQYKYPRTGDRVNKTCIDETLWHSTRVHHYTPIGKYKTGVIPSSKTASTCFTSWKSTKTKTKTGQLIYKNINNSDRDLIKQPYHVDHRANLSMQTPTTHIPSCCNKKSDFFAPLGAAFFNLTEENLPTEVVHTLNLGLKHIPTPHINFQRAKDTLINCVDRYARNFTIKLHFANVEYTQPTIPKIDNNNWMPPDDNSPHKTSMKAYLSSIKEAIKRINTPLNAYKSNPMDHYIRYTKKWLPSSGYIVKPSDKNLGACIMSKIMYESMCYVHLNDTTTYAKVSNYDTERIYKRLQDILHRHGVLYKSNNKRSINGENIKCFTPLARSLLQLQGKDTLRLAVFYVLPKLHKAINPIPSRPIVSNINSITYHASKYLHNLLWELRGNIKTIVFSTREALQRFMLLTNVKSTDCILCADVKALYPSIPINFGIVKVRSFLIKYLESRIVDRTCSILHWILTSNYMEFNNEVYLQLSGTAMGTPVAVMYANIVLYEMECNFLPNFTPIIYVRYIDDILVIINEVDAYNMVTAFNSQCMNIQLESVTVGLTGTFLDLSLTIKNGLLHTTLYQKSMNKYLYIKPTSQHNRKVLINFIRSEISRYRLYCSCRITFYMTCQQFVSRLRQRGYTNSIINEALSNLPTRSILFHNLWHPETRNNDGPIVVLDYTSKHVLNNPKMVFKVPEALKHTRDYQLAFGNSEDVTICYTNPPSLGQLLTRSKYAKKMP